MREKRGGGCVSCKDCYFRQELLCAIPGNDGCPTFRPTVGRAAVAPAQAPLIPIVAQVALRSAGVPVGAVAAIGSAPAAAPMLRAEAQAAAGEEEGVPFAGLSPEATFTVHEVQEAPVSVPAPAPLLRNAAAGRVGGEQCIVELVEDREPVAIAAEGMGAPVSGIGGAARRVIDAGRTSRVARRVAERYPQALQIC